MLHRKELYVCHERYVKSNFYPTTTLHSKNVTIYYCADNHLIFTYEVSNSKLPYYGRYNSSIHRPSTSFVGLMTENRKVNSLESFISCPQKQLPQPASKTRSRRCDRTCISAKASVSVCMDDFPGWAPAVTTRSPSVCTPSPALSLSSAPGPSSCAVLDALVDVAFFSATSSAVS